MKHKNPVNIFNGLKSKIEEGKLVIPKTTLVTIKAYQNSKNITKPFVKPISKII
jgi:hypothetical protein